MLLLLLSLQGATAAKPLSDAIAALERAPLTKVDASSPRDTLRSLIDNLKLGIALYRGDAPYVLMSRAFARATGLLQQPEQDTQRTQAEVGTNVASSPIARAKAVRNGILLVEVLSRIELPPYEAIPGDAEVKAEGLTSWSVPGTDIQLVQATKGSRKGEFLFSAQTIAELPEMYELVKDLPVTPGMASIRRGVRTILVSPGPLIPRGWFAGAPQWLFFGYAGAAVWQWIALMLTAALVLGWIVALIRLSRRFGGTRDGQSGWWQLIHPMVALVLMATTRLVERWLSGAGLNLTGTLMVSLLTALELAFYAALAWFVALVIARAGEVLVRATSARMALSNAELVRLVCRIIGAIAVAYVVIYAADRLQIPLAPLVAGLGISGLAVALAVRPTLENIIGGIVLFADRPVGVGEFCSFGDKLGTVEAIGLRSTRIRSLDRTLVTVPNSAFADLQIVNFSRRDKNLFRTEIGLRYETTSEQLRYVTASLREMLIRHPRVEPEVARVRFAGYGASSLNLEIFAHVDAADWAEYLAISEDLNLRIKDIVEEAGSGFAFPSQTLYLARDAGLDAERQAEATGEVEQWRRSRRLPFPEFAEAEVDAMANTLDYPPKGSPDYVRRNHYAHPMQQALDEARRRRWLFEPWNPPGKAGRGASGAAR